MPARKPSSWGTSYSFASLSEFLDFDITSKNAAGDVLEYRVKTVLQGRKGNCYADIIAVYKKLDGKWSLANATDSGTLKCL